MVKSATIVQTATTYTKWRSNMKKVAIIGNGPDPMFAGIREPLMIRFGEEMCKKLDEFNTPFIISTVAEQRRYFPVLSGQEKRRLRRKQNRSK